LSQNYDSYFTTTLLYAFTHTEFNADIYIACGEFEISFPQLRLALHCHNKLSSRLNNLPKVKKVASDLVVTAGDHACQDVRLSSMKLVF